MAKQARVPGTPAPVVTETAFDADRFSARPLSLKLNGREYALDGDPDVDILAAIARVEIAIRHGEEMDAFAAAAEGKRVLVAILAESNDNVPEPGDLRIGVGKLLSIFAFISGGRSAAEQVGEEIRMGQSKDDKEAPSEPLPLSKPSGVRSRGSASRTAGRQAGGKGSPGESSSSISEKRAATG